MSGTVDKKDTGRRSMFKDKDIVLSALKEFSQARKDEGSTCTVVDLTHMIKKKFRLPNPTGSIRQAVYRMVQENKIWTKASYGPLESSKKRQS